MDKTNMEFSGDDILMTSKVINIWRDHRIMEFAEESNLIEGIRDGVSLGIHYEALKAFLKLPRITIEALEIFVQEIQPGAKLRTKKEDRVWIGGREATPGHVVPAELQVLLDVINIGSKWQPPQVIHCHYEKIHPFMDGNGRSGRALWLWMMIHQENYDLRHLFLQKFYYQTLEAYKNGNL